MTSPQHDKPNWRLRFSVRTMAVVVTLVCCYAACWGPTMRQGVEDIEVAGGNDPRPWNRHHNGTPARALAPLVLAHDFPVETHYYFWFFGFVAKLPYEREISTTYSGIVPGPVPFTPDAESVKARDKLLKQLKAEMGAAEAK